MVFSTLSAAAAFGCDGIEKWTASKEIDIPKNLRLNFYNAGLKSL